LIARKNSRRNRQARADHPLAALESAAR